MESVPQSLVSLPFQIMQFVGKRGEDARPLAYHTQARVCDMILSKLLHVIMNQFEYLVETFIAPVIPLVPVRAKTQVTKNYANLKRRHFSAAFEILLGRLIRQCGRSQSCKALRYFNDMIQIQYPLTLTRLLKSLWSRLVSRSVSSKTWPALRSNLFSNEELAMLRMALMQLDSRFSSVNVVTLSIMASILSIAHDMPIGIPYLCLLLKLSKATKHWKRSATVKHSSLILPQLIQHRVTLKCSYDYLVHSVNLQVPSSRCKRAKEIGGRALEPFSSSG